MYALLIEGKHGKLTLNLDDGDRFFLRRALSTLSGCTLSSDDDVKAWWEAKGKTATFKPDAFKLEGDAVCRPTP